MVWFTTDWFSSHHTVRCAHKLGDVINFIIVACRISSRLKWYKNYKNRLRLAKVRVKNKMSRFVWFSVYYLWAKFWLALSHLGSVKLLLDRSRLANLYRWSLPNNLSVNAARNRTDNGPYDVICLFTKFEAGFGEDRRLREQQAEDNYSTCKIKKWLSLAGLHRLIFCCGQSLLTKTVWCWIWYCHRFVVDFTNKTSDTLFVDNKFSG